MWRGKRREAGEGGMSAVVPFAYGDQLVRVVEIDGAPWWVAGDVAKALGYRLATDMLKMLDEDEAAMHNVHSRSANGVVQSREVTIISESGVYHAIFKSRRTEAAAFRKWVTSEVLPSIRVNGYYNHSRGDLPVNDADPRWAMLDRRLDQLERLISSQAMVESDEFTKAVTFAPPVFRLIKSDGQVRKQAYSRYWRDHEVRGLMIALHRQMTLDDAVDEISAQVGCDRTPSRSALQRIWKQLDKARGAS